RQEVHIVLTDGVEAGGLCDDILDAAVGGLPQCRREGDVALCGDHPGQGDDRTGRRRLRDALERVDRVQHRGERLVWVQAAPNLDVHGAGEVHLACDEMTGI